MTVRLSMSSLAGTARTLVAVGTARLACMLVTTRAAGPFSVVTSPPPVEVVPGAFAADGAGEAAGEDAARADRARRPASGPPAPAAGAPSARGVAGAGAGCSTGRLGALGSRPAPVRRSRWSWRPPARRGGSPGRSPTRPCRRCPCPRGTAGRAPPRATRSGRTRPLRWSCPRSVTRRGSPSSLHVDTRSGGAAQPSRPCERRQRPRERAMTSFCTSEAPSTTRSTRRCRSTRSIGPSRSSPMPPKTCRQRSATA